MPNPEPSPHQIRALAVAAETDPKTARRYLLGLPVRDLSRLRLERAARVSKLALSSRQGPEDFDDPNPPAVA